MAPYSMDLGSRVLPDHVGGMSSNEAAAQVARQPGILCCCGAPRSAHRCTGSGLSISLEFRTVLGGRFEPRGAR